MSCAPQSCCSPCGYPVGGLGSLSSCCPSPCCSISTSCSYGPYGTIQSCPQPCCSPCSYPIGGLGSLSSCCPISCCPTSCCSTPCCGGSTSSACLGITSGANVGCVNQLPPSEAVIQPPPFVVTIPGPVLAASCEPLHVGGYTACGSNCCGLPGCGCLNISSC